MSSLLYQGHSIIYGAAFDEFTGEYAPTGQIAWQTGEGKRKKRSFTISRLFPTAYEAKAVAAEEAIAWTDQRLAYLRPETMQLRDHPLMTFRDLRNWPPAWVRLGTVQGKAPKIVAGEIGTLKEVRYYTDRRGRIYLTIDHDGGAYVGCVLFDALVFCEKVAEHLQRCCSMSINAIGSSDIALLRGWEGPP
jgi:hypothetical protein